MGTGLPELKGKLESGLSDNYTRLSSVREDNQLRIRTGKTIVEARVRAVANRSQESAGRQGDQPRIRTGKTSVEVRLRADRAGARGPPSRREPAAYPYRESQCRGTGTGGGERGPRVPGTQCTGGTIRHLNDATAVME